ncbi:hypothetical protein HO133_001935 [Letharia lupina]|uniref:Uncharacterized protein n=1 Tax=Letharia lupina TaxID=560253 RepID=A0A8H6CEF8_9LECA|nr:uncharacterized protein HO133_001935 [Letharia lupina]KAF6221967.1 hypothetical protein HO133_001935 [Letharia lupina]
MASPNEVKLSEQQSSNSNPTTPTSPATVEFPSAEIAGNEAQEEDEAAVLIPVADASDMENRHSEQVQGDSNRLVSDTAVMVISAGAINPQQRTLTEAAEAVPPHLISSTSDDLGADDAEQSDFNDEEGSDTDQDGTWDAIDLGPTAPTGEQAGNSIAGHGEAPSSMIREGSTSIVDNMEEYVIDGPTIIEGVLIEDSEDDRRTPALTSSERSVCDNHRPITPTATGFCHDDGEYGTSEVARPTGSDHGEEETRGSVTATSAGADDGNGDSSSSVIPASASPDHGDVESREPEMAMLVGSEQAGEMNDGSIYSSAASEGTPAPSQENDIPDESSSPMEATPSKTTEEGENQETAATPAHDVGEIASQADTETDHGHEVDLLAPKIPESPLHPTLPLGGGSNLFDIGEGEVQEPATAPTQELEDETASQADLEFDHSQEEVLLHASEIPESPLRPSSPLGEDPNDSDLDEGEAAPNPVARVSMLTGYRRPEGRGLNAGDNTERHIGGTTEDVGDNEADQGASRDPNPTDQDQPITDVRDRDAETVHLRIQYLVERSKRCKASICISVPSTITYRSLEQVILDALRQHGEFKNPHPIHADAQISRLIAVLTEKTVDTPGFCRERELTDENLQSTLELMTNRSIYDVVKVQFVPGTNGEVRPRKATGKVREDLEKPVGSEDGEVRPR